MLLPEIFKSPLIDSFYKVGNIARCLGLTASYRGRAGILCYHRVLPDIENENQDGPYAGLSVSITQFDQHMKFLAKNYNLVSMDELIERISDPQDNSFPVAITFDDGYKDNLYFALPVLERYGIPATIYIATRFIDGNEDRWWVNLWAVVKEKSELILWIDGQKYLFNLNSGKLKRRAYSILHDKLLSMQADKFDELMSQLVNKINCDNLPSVFMNWDELKELDKHSLITIGAHTKSHSNLASLPAESVLFEIQSGKKYLEERLNHAIRHFAYPYGRLREASEREYAVSRSCHFISSVTTRCQRIVSDTDKHKLPRHCITSRHSAFHIKTKLSGWNALWGLQG